MIDLLGRAILLSTVAALFVELLLKAWRVAQPGPRLTLRAASMLAGTTAPPLFDLIAPFRHDDWFVARWALFAGDRWNALGPGAVDLARLASGALALVGLVLLLFDVIPFARDWMVRRRIRRLACLDDGHARELVGELSNRLRLASPPLCVVDAPGLIVLCTGGARPRLLVSRVALVRLDSGERRAALAHELVHAKHRDPLLGWALLLVRLTAWFSPAIQLQARAVVADLERRADDEGAAATGDPVALASAIVRLGRRPLGWAARPAWSTAISHARARSLEMRCRRLLEPRAGDPAPPGAGHLVAAVSVIVLLLFLVV